MSRRHLLLSFDAPLMAFGGVMVDAYGKIDPLPSPSLLAGLLGNALGYARTEGARLNRLQARLRYAVGVRVPGVQITDFQTADLDKDDKGWTTRGAPEGRAGGAGTYAGKHIRYRDYWADRQVCIAVRLDPADEEPSLEAVAEALDFPARPLFLGRKPCLPAGRLLAGEVFAPTAVDALPRDVIELFYPAGEAQRDNSEAFRLHGERDWISGVHGGPTAWVRASGMVTGEQSQ